MHQSIELMAILMHHFCFHYTCNSICSFFSKCLLVYFALFWLMEPLHVRDKWFDFVARFSCMYLNNVAPFSIKKKYYCNLLCFYCFVGILKILDSKLQCCFGFCQKVLDLKKVLFIRQCTKAACAPLNTSRPQSNLNAMTEALVTSYQQSSDN